MESIAILMLGAGKRVSLARHFRVAAELRGINLSIYAYESCARQPIGLEAQVLIGKPWGHAGVVQDLLDVAAEFDIQLITSHVDQATRIHAELRDRLPAASFCSAPRTVNVCSSKRLTHLFCETNGIPTIPLAQPGVFPMFGKPDQGSASEGIRKLHDAAELNSYLARNKDVIVQQYVDGVEYSVDAYVARDGQVLGVSPRIRVSTTGGESTITETVSHPEIEAQARTIIELLELRGPLTLQFIVPKESERSYLMEVNPRFGGGVMASIKAGYDFPGIMLDELRGEVVAPVRHGRQLVAMRYLSEVFYEAGD